MSEEITDDMTEDQLAEDISKDWWTVIGFGHETWQRWGGHYDCLTPRMAEDLAMMEAKEDGWTLAVVAVFEGKHDPADTYATWVDPDVHSDSQMKDRLRSLGYIR